MKDFFFKKLIKFLYLLLLSLNVFSGGNESDSLLLKTLDDVLIEEYKPCSDQSAINSFEVSTISSLMIVSNGGSFSEGEVITSSSGVQAIVDSYDVETQKLTFHQNANTGFETFVLNETITGDSSETVIVKEFIIDLEGIISNDLSIQDLDEIENNQSGEIKYFNNSALSVISSELVVHPENSLKILFSIP